jgi:CheY-like chemotaxis protein
MAYTPETKQTKYSSHMPERTYTTHDIAAFCDVYPSSVVHWINTGKLKSYATPGGHHRVTREDLLDFFRRFSIPVPAELARRTRVLIVEDDEEVSRVLARAFSRYTAFETEVCHDGVSALIRIGQQPPDIILLDLVLPKMDGPQVCKVLKSRKETRDIKIIAITGRKPPAGERLAGYKADALFRKPLDLLEVVAAASQLCGVDTLTRAK